MSGTVNAGNAIDSMARLLSRKPSEKSRDGRNSEENAILDFLHKFAVAHKSQGGIKTHNLDVFVQISVLPEFVRELRSVLGTFPELDDGNKMHLLLEGQYIRLDMGGFFLRRFIDRLPEDFSSDDYNAAVVGVSEYPEEVDDMYGDGETDLIDEENREIESSNDEPSEMPETELSAEGNDDGQD